MEHGECWHMSILIDIECDENKEKAMPFLACKHGMKPDDEYQHQNCHFEHRRALSLAQSKGMSNNKHRLMNVRRGKNSYEQPKRDKHLRTLWINDERRSMSTTWISLHHDQKVTKTAPQRASSTFTCSNKPRNFRNLKSCTQQQKRETCITNFLAITETWQRRRESFASRISFCVWHETQIQLTLSPNQNRLWRRLTWCSVIKFLKSFSLYALIRLNRLSIYDFISLLHKM